MFSKSFFNGLKKTTAVFLAVCMLVSLLTCLTVITAVAEPDEPGGTVTPVSTETAVFIGKTGVEKQAAIFMPVDIKHPTDDSNLFTGEEMFQVSFKCKMLSGSKPAVGVYDVDDSNNKAWARVDWCDQNSVVIEDGVCTAMIKVNFHRRVEPNGEGYRSFYLVIGNSYYNGSETAYGDFEDAFILSDVKLVWYDSDEEALDVDDETGEEVNRLPEFTAENINFKGTYFFKADGCDNWDSPLGANTMKWHIMAAPAYIKQITVPSDYNVSENYAAANFTKTEETDFTREYYTNDNYPGKYFAALKNSNGAGFEIISSDINKKMIIIDANHEGEEDVRDVDGYKPTNNKAANIFLPISYGQYAMTGGTAEDINFLVKITFKAVRLEGEGYPVLGRIVGKKSGTDGKGSTAFGKMAKNLHLSGYYTASDHEVYNGGDYSYNEETGEFVGWMRVRAADNDYATRWGCNEVITIGNAEHVWQEGTFDTTEFNSSFAISDIKVDVYSCIAPTYTVGELVAEDVAPALYADNIDDTSVHAYQYRGSTASNNDWDCIRASQYLWSAEGNVGMVHAEDLTVCMKDNHKTTHHEATESTREYWSCSCGKTFADAYGKTEVFDLSAADCVIKMNASANPESVFIPIKLSGFTGYQWHKFTCKCKLIDSDTAPVVTTLYATYYGYKKGGKNGESGFCEPTNTTDNDGDMSVVETTYDPETYTLTAYIKAWLPSNYNKSDRYPFVRYNPHSDANIAIVIGNGRYIGSGGYGDKVDTGFAIAQPELYKLDCTSGSNSGLDTAKSAASISDNLIAPITNRTVDFESEHVAIWTNKGNPLSAPRDHWYKMAQDDEARDAIVVKTLPENYFTADYVECPHEQTRVEPAVASTCCTQGHGEYTYCITCNEVLEGSDALLPLDPTNHEGETEVRDAVAATCKDHGYTGNTYCLGCGAKIADGEETDFADHTIGDWLTDATYHWHYCSVCEGALDQAEHTYEWVVTKEATAEENGTESEVCSVCGYATGNTRELIFVSHMAGDINGDKAVNNKDLTRLFQYLSDWEVEVDESALDVNGDGSVNNKDLTRLFQYLSDWDVEIF